jgi:superfamily I DNA/RNA helicase
MKKNQILKLKQALKKAQKFENQAQMAAQTLAALIEEFTGVIGSVDHLQGDGFGFTPESNNDTHVGIDEIIKWALNGEEITEQLILDRLSF